MGQRRAVIPGLAALAAARHLCPYSIHGRQNRLYVDGLTLIAAMLQFVLDLV
jgi:hypothetical protein